MSAESPKPFGQMMPPMGTAEPLGVRLIASDAGRKMAEMEHLFRSAGNHTAQMEALRTLECWQVDPRLDRASRQKASALIWKFQPNGWVEI